jgi:glutathione S-transferase
MQQQNLNKLLSMRLITIPISHYCEKVRWALDWLELPYTEERHVPFFHRLATSRDGGKSVPVLVTQDGTYTDSTDILHYLDTKNTKSKKLYPSEPKLRQEVNELEELFDTRLGNNIRRWGYFYRIHDREGMRRSWCTGTPGWEKAGFAIAFPVMRKIVQQTYNITAASAKDSLQEIKQIFEVVNQRLSDARPYLIGDNLSAADLTFAALAAPVLLPPEHPIKPPALETFNNDEMIATIKELRATPAGVYALRLYQKQRHNQLTINN